MEQDSPIIQQFLNYLKFERRFSEHTAKCYGADLTQYSEFLTGQSNTSESNGAGDYQQYGDQGGTATATQVSVDQLLKTSGADEARAYLGNLNEKNYSKATIARKLAPCVASTSTWSRPIRWRAIRS